MRGRRVDSKQPTTTKERYLAVELDDGLLELLHQLAVHAAVHKDIVGREARLPCVHETTPGDSPRRDLNVCVLVHDARAVVSRRDIPAISKPSNY